MGDIGCSKGKGGGCEEKSGRMGVEEGEEGGHVRDEEEGKKGKRDADGEDGGKVHRKRDERYVEKGFLGKKYLYANPKALRMAWQGGVSWADRKEARRVTKEAYGKQSQGGKSNLSFPSLTPPPPLESSPSPGSQSPLPEPLAPLPGLSLNPSKEVRPEYGISININGGMIQVDTTTETTPIGRGKGRIIQKGKGKGEGKGRGKGKGRGGGIEKVSWKGKGPLTGHNLVGIVAEEREIFWGDGLLEGEGRMGVNLNLIVLQFKNTPLLSWVALQETHLTLKMAIAVSGMLKRQGLLFYHSSGVRGKGGNRPRSEVAGVGFILRASAVEVLSSWGDQLGKMREFGGVEMPNGEIQPGRIIFLRIRHVIDPRSPVHCINMYADQPGTERRLIEATYASWLYAMRYLIALYQQVITVGDMNAEPPDVVDARKKPNNTRKVAEDILRKGVNEFPLEVLSGRVVTHHQNTRGGAQSHTAIDLILATKDYCGLIQFVRTTAPYSAPQSPGEYGNYHNGLQIRINLIAKGKPPERGDPSTPFRRMPLPGLPEIRGKGGVITQEATGWLKVRAECRMEIPATIEALREANTPEHEIIRQVILLMNEITIETLKEEIGEWGFSLSILFEAYKRADVLKSIAERAQRMSDAHKGERLRVGLDEIPGGVGEPKSVMAARALPRNTEPSYFSTLAGIVKHNQRVAHAIAVAYRMEADAALREAMEKKHKVIIRTINEELVEKAEENQMGFFKNAIDIIKASRDEGCKGADVMASIHKGGDPKAELVSGAAFKPEFSEQFARKLAATPVCEESLHHLITISGAATRAVPPSPGATLLDSCGGAANILRRVGKFRLGKSTGLTGISMYPLRWIEPELAVTLGSMMLKGHETNIYPKEWSEQKVTLIPKPRKNRFIVANRRDIWVTEQPRMMSFGLLAPEFSRVGREVRSPFNTGWCTFRTVSAQTLALRSGLEQAIEDREMVVLAENDKKGFFMSIQFIVQEIIEQRFGVHPDATMANRVIFRDGKGYVQTAYGKVTLTPLCGDGQGDINGPGRAVLVIMPSEFFCALVIPGFRMAGPPGLCVRIPTVPQADDNASTLENNHVTQALFDQEAHTASVAELEHGFGPGKTQVVASTPGCLLPTPDLSLSFEMPCPKGGPPRSVECAKESIHMGHGLNLTLDTTVADKSAKTNARVLAKELAAFYVANMQDWRLSVKTVAIGTIDYKGRATPLDSSVGLEVDAFLRNLTAQRGFIPPHFPTPLFYLTTRAGGCGFTSAVGVPICISRR